MKNINDLPSYDIWPIIFRNLSVDDLFNCRLVNKQFKHFSDHSDGINKLIIGQSQLTPGDCYWYCIDKTIEDKDIISLKCFRNIKFLSIFNLDKNLKYLKIHDEKLQLKELSKFKNLESIEFGYFYRSDLRYINIKNLKFFVLNFQSVKLNAPKLEKIQFSELNEIKFNSNPESIKHLITMHYKSKFEIFKNLEIIELRDTFKYITGDLLIIFKNLKKFNINLEPGFLNYSDKGIGRDVIKILNDKLKLKRCIDIYLEGIKIENIYKLNEIKGSRFSDWKFRLNNYDLLDLNLPFINQLRYEELEQCVNIKNGLPISFFDKFQNIHLVEVRGVNDVDGLSWFLNNLKYLTKLRIYSIGFSLGQVFYNNLPSTIRNLYISNKEDVDYDFVLKLSKLIEFHTEFDKDLYDLAFTSFFNLKYLNRFEFRFKRDIRIEADNFKSIFERYKIDKNFSW